MKTTSGHNSADSGVCHVAAIFVCCDSMVAVSSRNSSEVNVSIISTIMSN